MAQYVKSTNFTAKDTLVSGDPLKKVKGTEIDVEFNAIATAISSKADAESPTFTGTPLAPTATAGTNTTQLATTAFVKTAVDNFVVTTTDVQDLAITTAKIADDAVTAAKLADTGVTAGTYGSSTTIPSITVNAQGQVTSVNSVSKSSLKLISKQNVINSTASGIITASLPTSLFEGNTPTFVMFQASAAWYGISDMRYYRVSSGNTYSLDDLVLGMSSDDTDQGGTASFYSTNTFVLPYSSSQQFLVEWYIPNGSYAGLRINVVGYQV